MPTAQHSLSVMLSVGAAEVETSFHWVRSFDPAQDDIFPGVRTTQLICHAGGAALLSVMLSVGVAEVETSFHWVRSFDSAQDDIFSSCSHRMAFSMLFCA